MKQLKVSGTFCGFFFFHDIREVSTIVVMPRPERIASGGYKGFRVPDAWDYPEEDGAQLADSFGSHRSVMLGECDAESYDLVGNSSAYSEWLWQ